MRQQSVNVFVCFDGTSQQDVVLLEELDKHLKLLQAQKNMELWDERRIRGGKMREAELIRHIASAQVVLLLVSPDFLISDYVKKGRLLQIIERQKRGEVVVIPIIARPCDWQNEAFGEIQALPANLEPITSPIWPTPDYAYVKIANGIKLAIEDLYQKKLLPMQDESEISQDKQEETEPGQVESTTPTPASSNDREMQIHQIQKINSQPCLASGNGRHGGKTGVSRWFVLVCYSSW